MSEQTLHPPYPAKTAALGGLPTVGVDVPICSVFLVLFIIGAVAHMTILQANEKKGHRFLISGMTFGFCMSRIVTMVMRIVWANYPTNVRVAIASNIFVAAGVVLLFVINLLFAQRIIRAAHPRSGWHPLFHYFFIVIYVIIFLSLCALITSVIQSFYTLNLNTKRIDRDILLYGVTFYSVISFLPIVLVIGGLVIPRKTRVEKFGSGRFRHKIAILLVASVLLCSGATFRAAVNYAGGKRPRTNPAKYQNKACFYIFNFTVEILVVYLYVLVRVDKRFFVPNGSHGPGDYSRKPESELEKNVNDESTEGMHITSEEETFDLMSPEELARKDQEKNGVVDEEKAIPSQSEIVDHERNGVMDEEKAILSQPETKDREENTLVDEEKAIPAQSETKDQIQTTVVDEEKALPSESATKDQAENTASDQDKAIPSQSATKHEDTTAASPIVSA